MTAAELQNCRHILILGNNGSGKSHLARRLGSLTGLPVIHLDAAFWKPGWKMPSREEWLHIQQGFICREHWILDGNHISTLEPRFRAADAVIFLDFSRFVCQAGILKRFGKRQQDMPDFLKDQLNLDFFRFCKRMWQFPKTGRKRILALHGKYPDTVFLSIKRRRDLETLLLHWAAAL